MAWSLHLVSCHFNFHNVNSTVRTTFYFDIISALQNHFDTVNHACLAFRSYMETMAVTADVWGAIKVFHSGYPFFFFFCFSFFENQKIPESFAVKTVDSGKLAQETYYAILMKNCKATLSTCLLTAVSFAVNAIGLILDVSEQSRENREIVIRHNLWVMSSPSNYS